MSDGKRRRLDEALVAAGLAPSRSRARDMVRRGTVSVGGRAEMRCSRRIAADDILSVGDPASRYVSRAAMKLLAGLQAFGFDPTGLNVLDLGASTGGFTQVLLEGGAAHVIAVDVGHGQLHPSLANDRRITSHEGLNARDLMSGHLGGHSIGAVVADVSFISLKLALASALVLTTPGAWGVFLVKPQFEVGRTHVGKGGVVRNPMRGIEAVQDIAAWLEREHGWESLGFRESPLRGGDGNAEYLLGARRG